MKKDELNRRLKERVRKLIKDYGIIRDGELIALALSGGKDSLLMLYLLNDLKDELGFRIIAITVDEGIEGYREEGIRAARHNTGLLGVELIEKSFKREFGFSLDEVCSVFKSPCIPCGVFRRYILNKTAHEIGADKIAIGHNMDDEIQSFLMSFARGDIIKFSKFGPELEMIHPALIPRIKPLWNIPENETRMWAVLNDINAHLGDCPYARFSLRSKIKEFLNIIESKRHGTKRLIMDSFMKTFKIEGEKVELSECEICGEPTSSRICRACELMNMIRDSL